MNFQSQRITVLFSGICSLILLVGVARFAYTPLLPRMLEETSLTHSWGGWLATLNYIGYMIGAVLAAVITSPHIKYKLYKLGLILGVLTTVVMGITDSLWVWALSRFIAGISSAAGLLLASGLILNWLMRNGHKSELGIHFGGIGFGIMIAAASVELMTPHFTQAEQWIIFTIIGAVAFIPAWFGVPAPLKQTDAQPTVNLEDNPPSKLFLGLLTTGYFFAGVGYVVSATFTVAIIDALPGLEGQGWLAFFLIGLGAAPSPILWDYIARPLGYSGAMLIAFLVQIPSILLPAFFPTTFVTLFSTLMFGLSFLGIVSLVLTMAGVYFPNRPSKMMGKMTLSYGAAQIIGPAIIGWLVTYFGDYSFGLYMAGGAMVIGSFITLAQLILERRERNLSYN